MMRCRCVERPGYPWGRLRLLSLLVVSRFLPAHTTGAPVGQPPGLTLTPMDISPQVPESVPWGSRLHLSAALRGAEDRVRALPCATLGTYDTDGCRHRKECTWEGQNRQTRQATAGPQTATGPRGPPGCGWPPFSGGPPPSRAASGGCWG